MLFHWFSPPFAEHFKAQIDSLVAEAKDAGIVVLPAAVLLLQQRAATPSEEVGWLPGACLFAAPLLLCT